MLGSCVVEPKFSVSASHDLSVEGTNMNLCTQRCKTQKVELLRSWLAAVYGPVYLCSSDTQKHTKNHKCSSFLVGAPL